MSRTFHKEKAEKKKGHKAGCKCWQCDKIRSYNRRMQVLKAKGESPHDQ